jgi:uncharacterized protein GlcG (DUF336 family)
MKSASAALALLLMAGAAQAQAPAAPAPPPPVPGVPADLALEAAQTAMASCVSKGFKVGVAVADSAGGLRFLLSTDAAGQRGVDGGVRKAMTVVAYKMASGEVEARTKADPALAARITADPKLLARQGGLPIVTKTGQFLGAIGVGGAPGGDKDEACAAAGLAMIKSRLD